MMLCTRFSVQTRFVLQKAIELGLKPLVVINKVDKENCRPEEVQEKVFDLMFNLDATEDQLDFPTIYGSAKLGWMNGDYKNENDNFESKSVKTISFGPMPIQPIWTKNSKRPQIQRFF